MMAFLAIRRNIPSENPFWPGGLHESHIEQQFMYGRVSVAVPSYGATASLSSQHDRRIESQGRSHRHRAAQKGHTDRYDQHDRRKHRTYRNRRAEHRPRHDLGKLIPYAQAHQTADSPNNRGLGEEDRRYAQV